MAVTGVNEYTNAYAASNSAGAKGSSGLSETAFGQEIKRFLPFDFKEGAMFA